MEKRIIDNKSEKDFYEILNPSEEDICWHIDDTRKKAMEGDLFALEELADIMTYYGRYDMAERLYNKVIELDKNPNKSYSRSSFAYIGLGDLYLNNYIGNTDYQTAYSNYMMACFYGNSIAKQKIAYMYKNGIGFKKDYKRYVELITEIYQKYKKRDDILLDIWYEMAMIKYNNKDYDGAREILKIFDLGGGFSAINIFTVKNDLNIIINIRKLQYKLGLIDENDFDFYAIDALGDKYSKFSFKYRNKKFEVCIKKDGGNKYYEFEGRNYETLADMIFKCEIQGHTILEEIDKFTNMKIIE